MSKWTPEEVLRHPQQVSDEIAKLESELHEARVITESLRQDHEAIHDLFRRTTGYTATDYIIMREEIRDAPRSNRERGKWTPGPWVAIVPDKPCIHNGSDITNFSIHSTSAYHDAGRVDNKTIVSGEFMERIGHEESAANARLIAASPEMVELLQRYLASADSPLGMAAIADIDADARALLARLEADK